MSPLLNYTTKVPVEKTIAEVHATLVKAGARQIMTNYGDGGIPTEVVFQFVGRAYSLPARAEKVLAVLARSYRPNNSAHAGPPTIEQAQRVAWRIVKDWIEAQLAIVETEMVTFDEVMLPYMRAADGRTLYELYVGGELPALGAGS